MSNWLKTEKLNRLSIIEEISRQHKLINNIKNMKSSFASTFSHSRSSSRFRVQKFNSNIRYYGLPLPIGIKPSKQIDKENKKMLDRIVSTKPCISNRVFSNSSRDEKLYRDNILKSKFKHPDYMKEAKKCRKKGKVLINFSNLYKYGKTQENMHTEVCGKFQQHQ